MQLISKNIFGVKCHYTSAILLICLFFITACSKLDKMELNKGDNPLALTADKASVVLEEINRNADAVTLTWTSGTNKGTNAGITYILKIDKKGNNFANAFTQDLGKGASSKKFTVKELNDLVVSRWGSAGEEVTLEGVVEMTVRYTRRVSSAPLLYEGRNSPRVVINLNSPAFN